MIKSEREQIEGGGDGGDDADKSEVISPRGKNMVGEKGKNKAVPLVHTPYTTASQQSSKFSY